MQFLLASGNAHKASEFSKLFDPNILEVLPSPDKIEVEETGTSYQENAFLKASGYYSRFKKPVMADDSGLNVESLPDELGIHSARFGGQGLSDQDRAKLLIEKLADNPNRNAYFSCVLCFFLSPEEVFFFEGRLEGSIGFELLGSEGFGYDPVFIPDTHPDKNSLAMDPIWKETHSHRFVAAQLAQKFFKERSL